MTTSIAIARIIAALFVDVIFFVGAIYAGHIGVFPRELVGSVVTALVIVRTQTQRGHAASGGQPPSGGGSSALPASAAGALAAWLGWSWFFDTKGMLR